MSTTQGKAYVPDVLNQFNSIVKYIYDQGGRTFGYTIQVPLVVFYMIKQKEIHEQVTEASFITTYSQ
ncbi:hypothetical protein PS2_011398 [Malus domestica]